MSSGTNLDRKYEIWVLPNNSDLKFIQYMIRNNTFHPICNPFIPHIKLIKDVSRGNLVTFNRHIKELSKNVECFRINFYDRDIDEESNSIISRVDSDNILSGLKGYLCDKLELPFESGLDDFKIDHCYSDIRGSTARDINRSMDYVNNLELPRAGYVTKICIANVSSSDPCKWKILRSYNFEIKLGEYDDSELYRL